MAAGTGVTLDSVTIEINSSVGDTTQNIESLKKTLGDLKSVVSGGIKSLSLVANNLNLLNESSKNVSQTVTNLSKISELTDNLKSLGETQAMKKNVINRINDLVKLSANVGESFAVYDGLSRVAENLASLSTVPPARSLTTIVKNLKGLGELAKQDTDNIINFANSITKIIPALNEFSTVKEAKSFTSIINAFAKIPNTMNKLESSFQKIDNVATLENIKRVATEVAEALKPLSTEMAKIGAGYSAIGAFADKYGVSISSVNKHTKQSITLFGVLRGTLNGIRKGFSTLGTVANKVLKPINSEMKKIRSVTKQVILSLAGTRTLYTFIRKAASEYANFDMEFQKMSTNIWRALGAQLAPAMEYAMYLFKQFARVVYSVVKALTGIDLIARANAKAMASYAGSTRAVNKELGNLQKFDDLNVVDFPKDSGSGSDFEPIKLDEIDLSPIQKVIDWVTKLKEAIMDALDTGRWYNVGKVFGEGINDGVEYLISKLDVVKEKLYNIAYDFADTLNGFIETVKWDNIGKLIGESIMTLLGSLDTFLSTLHWDSIGKSINDFFKGFPLVGLVDSVMLVLGDIAGGLAEAFVNIEWGEVAQKLSDSIVTFFSDLTAILNKIPWYQIGEKLQDAILNINWVEIWNSVVGFAESAFDNINEFLSGFTGLDVDSIERLEVALIGIGVAFKTYELVKMASGFAKAVGDIGTAISLLGKGTLTTETISGITGASSGLLNVLTPLVDILTPLGELLTGGAFGTLGSIAAAIGVIAGVVVAVTVAFKDLYNSSESFRETVNKLVEGIQGTFSKVLEAFKTILDRLGASLKNIYEKILKPIVTLLIDMLKPIISAVMSVLEVLWNNVLSPIVDFALALLIPAFDMLCNQFDVLVDVVGVAIDVLKWLWKNILEPIVSFLLDVLVGAIKLVGSIISTVVTTATAIIKTISTTVENVWAIIKNVVYGVADYVYNHMIKPLTDRFENFKNNVVGIWNAIKDGARNALNGLLGWVESGLNRIIRGINNIIDRATGKLSKFFSWLGFEMEVKHISEISIPKLETGTNEIPYEGLYHLHPGEAVVPKKYNPALGGGSNDETNQRLDRLITLMDNMNFTNIVNIGDEQLYKKQQSYNKRQENKYGTLSIY